MYNKRSGQAGGLAAVADRVFARGSVRKTSRPGPYFWCYDLFN